MLFVSAAAVAAWVALLTAGMFEYNCGDSEVLTMFLFMMGAPHAAKPKAVISPCDNPLEEKVRPDPDRPDCGLDGEP